MKLDTALTGLSDVRHQLGCDKQTGLTSNRTKLTSDILRPVRAVSDFFYDSEDEPI